MSLSSSNQMSTRQEVARRPGFTIFARANRLLPEALPFQDPIDEICEQPASTFLRSTHYLVVALFIALLLVAALTKVDVVVIAPGRIATATPPVVLQPMERAIIREVHVHPGDTVFKGQVLALLDPTFVAADAEALEKQLRTLQAQTRRLDAESEGRWFDAGAASDAEDGLQGSLFRQRQVEYASRLQVFDEDIQRLRATLQGAVDDRRALGREVDVARAVEKMRVTLLQLQIGSKLNLLEAQAARLHAERDQQDAADRLVEALHGMVSRQAERQSFINGWRRELLDSLVGARTELARVTAALAKAARLQDLVVVQSPVDGVVLDVAQRTEGSVLREAEPLLTIVPRGVEMIAEITIPSGDVGEITPGAEVQLKMDAFPFQRDGVVTGRLLSIGQESFSGGGAGAPLSGGHSGAYHPGRVALPNVKPGSLAARLFPGMTMTAEIKAGSRSVLSYFLYPLTRGLGESIREP